MKWAGVFLLYLTISVQLIAQTYTCPPNLDFEQGNFTNWECYTGGISFSGVITVNTGPLPVFGRHTLMSGAGVDPYGGFPVVSPTGGGFSVKIGNDAVGAQAERIRYKVRVPAGAQNFGLVYNFAVVFEEPTTGHLPSEMPRYILRVYDSATNKIDSCSNYLYVASSNLPGFTQVPVAKRRLLGTPVWYNPWRTGSLNLKKYAGKTLYVEVVTTDCSQTGHFGYGYFDATCRDFNISITNCDLNPSTILTGPPGFQKYYWYDSTLTNKIDSGISITINTPPQNTKYKLIVLPYPGYGCPDTLQTIVKYSNFTVQSPNDTILCRGDSTMINASANGNSTTFNYLWTPNKNISCTTCTSPIIKPDSSRTYYVLVTDQFLCTKMDSFFVKVNQLPKLSSSKVTTAICSGDTFKYTATSTELGTKFSWTRPSVSGISPTSASDTTNKIKEKLINTTNAPITVTYYFSLVSNGCPGFDTIQVIVKPIPKLNSANTLSSICSGSTVNYSASSTIAGTTISWVRTSNIGISPSTASASSNTINDILTNQTTDSIKVLYTFTLSANGCVNTDTVTIVVKPIPKLNSNKLNNTVCSGKLFSYTPTSATTNTNISWTRNTVVGISNAASNGIGNINETLINTTSSPKVVQYFMSLSAANCNGLDTINLLVNPLTSSIITNTICQGQSYLGRTSSGTYIDTLFGASSLGCDSIRTLILTVNPTTFFSISQTICEGSSVLFNGVNRTVSGTYLDTLVNAKGCDSILTLNLTVNPKTFSTINQTICQGSSFLGRSTSGTYIDTLFGANSKGCDSIRTLILTVNPKSFGSFSQTICEGASVLFNGVNRTVSGAYLDTLVNAKGCDSIVTFNLTVNPKTFSTINQTICQGSSFLGRSTSGTYIDTLAGANSKGCDSIRTLILTVNPKTFGSINQTICQGSSFLFNNISQTVSGTYLDTLVNAKGCDSILTLNLTVNPKTFSTINQTICQGSSFLGRSTSGTYIDTLFGANAKGCDSIRTLILNVNPKSFGSFSQTICEGASVLFNGVNRTVSGTYLDTLVNAKGCDSIVTFNLTVNPKTFSTINQTICQGSSFLGRSTSGTYIDTLIGANAKGCDSIRTLILTVNPKTFGSINQIICQGSSFLFNNISRTVSGTYLDTLVNAKGCDSILTLNLTVNPKTFSTINQTICQGSSFLGRSTSGTYIDTLIGANAKGCDSIRTLILTVNPKTFSTINQTICQGSSFLGRSTSGTYIDTLIGANAKGCDSIRTLILTVNPKTFSTINQTICQGSSFLGRSTSGTYIDTLIGANAKGCDSIRTLILTVNPKTFGSFSQTICEGASVLFNGVNRTVSGTYLDTLVNAKGCDSIVTFNLTVNPKTFGSINQTICQGSSFLFNNISRTVSGTYLDTLINAKGCDSILTLNLTVNPKTFSTINQTICQGSSFLGRSTSGTYIDTLFGANAKGCDSIRTLVLTVNPKTFGSINQTICQGSSFLFNNISRTVSGIYLDTLVNAKGCDSILTLNLTVNPKTFSTINQTICQGSSFIGRTTSGTYIDTLIGANAKGCDSIRTLILTVNPKTFGSFSQTICEGASVLFNGVNRTVSGAYLDTLVNAKGCDSIVTFNLTVNPKTFGSINQTICQGSSFLFNNISRTASGTYLDTLVNANGCDSILTLTLTVNPKTFSTVNQTICQGSSFLGRSTSGTYIDTLFGANSKGCDSIRTLILTVNPKTFSTITNTICEGQSFLGRTTSGTYIDTLIGANSNGCDSIRTLVLTVNPRTYFTITQTICEGGVVLGRTKTGVYRDTLVNAKGCDSIRILNLTVHPTTYFTINKTICEGETFLDRMVSGTYRDTFVNAKGCDSIRILNLTVHPTTYSTVNKTICEGESFLGRTTSGTYIDTLFGSNAKGCDSIRTLILTVNPKTYSTINQIICEGQAFLGRTNAGSYIDTIKNVNGCDSIRTLNLSIIPKTYSTINKTICEGESFFNRTLPGTYIDTLINARGCDSLRKLILTVNPITRSALYQTICEGKSYEGYSKKGVYFDTFVNMYSCDSIRTIFLDVLPKKYSMVSKSICEGESYKNKTKSGIYFDTLTSTKGCDSIVKLVLEVQGKVKIGIDTPVHFCLGEYKYLNARGGLYYSWSPGATLNDSTIQYPQAFPKKSMVYTVKVSNDCFTDSAKFPVYVDTVPKVHADPDTTIMWGTSAKLHAVSNVHNYNWSPKDLIPTPFSNEIEVSPLDSQLYTVQVIDKSGCVGMDSVWVFVDGTVVILVPTAFTPNGDGLNDIFRVGKYIGIKRITEFSVFNRSGDMVYTTSDIEKGWDGQFNGEDAPMSVFVWYVKAITYKNKEIFLKGNVTLIR